MLYHQVQLMTSAVLARKFQQSSDSAASAETTAAP